MTVIDLNNEKYVQNDVVVKCGDKEFRATPDDKTLNKVIAVSKKQMADGYIAGSRLDKLSSSDLNDNQIKALVNDAVNTMAGAKEDYIDLANAIFGRGAGNAIYKAVGNSTVAMSNVMEDVVNELYAKNKETQEKYKREAEEV